MSTRLNFRPRPLDLQKQLPIVRDINELDPPTEGSKDVLQTVEAREIEAKKPKKGSEIPIPMVRVIPTYEREYLPLFREQNTYIRGRGGVGHRDEKFVEYDMDEADEKWLAKFNQGQDRLPGRRFELLIWRLELANAEANDRHSAATGTGIPDRISPGVVAQIGNMRKDEALHIMSRTHALRQPVLQAVYSYWREKRVKRGKPLLRRLQAPTATSDSNPFNVFRPRDKIHRPQTRRRRENNEESLDKMRTLRQNLVKAYEVLEWLTRREQRKCNLVYIETDLQQLQLRQQHDPRHTCEATEAEYAQQAKLKQPKRPLNLDKTASPAFDTSASTGINEATNLNRFKRRKKDARRSPAPPVNQLPSPPLQTEPDMLFADAPDAAHIAQRLSAAGNAFQTLPQMGRARIGRGGRLMFDRCQAFTYKPFEPTAAAEAEQNGVAGLPAVKTEMANGLAPAGMLTPLNGSMAGH